MSEMVECRYDGCNRTFESENGRNSHEGHGHSGLPPSAPDKELLEELYQDYKSLKKIGDEFGYNRYTVRNWLEQAGVEVNDRSYYWKQQAPKMYTDEKGYERIIVNEDGENKTFRHHQLLAIANGVSPQKVFCEDYDIHHKNRIRWDNRPSNIEAMKRSDHMSHHHSPDQ